MIICLVLALYLIGGLITASIFVKSLEPYNIRPFKEVLADVQTYGANPELYLEMNLAFRKTNAGFLLTILTWPVWAVAMIHDAIYAKNKNK